MLNPDWSEAVDSRSVAAALDASVVMSNMLSFI